MEETGKVDVATIATLAVQLMGGDFNESEKDLVNKKAEVKAESGKSMVSLSVCAFWYDGQASSIPLAMILL